jgi:methionyl-tRNA formyltransferase
MKELRIIFMGTPDFAVPSLEILIQNRFNVVAVITAPDKAAGRGKKIRTSAVKDCALKHNLPILQPTNLKSPDFIEILKTYNANLQIVVAFRMLPEVVWDMPELGTFNLHASLLPQYRGAAPINWAIINGETETGLTTFFLQHKIDTGDVILQEKETILPTDTIGTLYERLKLKGGKLILQTLQKIQEGNYKLIPQIDSEITKAAPKIFAVDCVINFEQSSLAIYNFVRGLSPYPAAKMVLNGKRCKVFSVELVEENEGFEANDTELKVGEYFTDNKKFLYIKTLDGFVSIKELQLEGRKRMEIKAFLAGAKL